MRDISSEYCLFANDRKVTFTLRSLPPLSWANFESSLFFPNLGIVAVFVHRRPEILAIDKSFLCTFGIVLPLSALHQSLQSLFTSVACSMIMNYHVHLCLRFF